MLAMDKMPPADGAQGAFGLPSLTFHVEDVRCCVRGIGHGR